MLVLFILQRWASNRDANFVINSLRFGGASFFFGEIGIEAV